MKYFRCMVIFIMLIFPLAAAQAAVEFPSDLDAAAHPKFVNPLPIPARVNATGGGKYTVDMRDVVQFLGIYDTETADPLANPLNTTVWGYNFQGNTPTYPGRTLVARKDVPVEVTWQNKLPKGPHLLPLDTSIHLVDPIKKTLQEGNIPVVTHLHGGHSESASDGLPEAWFTQGFAETGPQWVKKTYYYDNDQEAATLWYHDHALGITRLNVYAGLAGFYLLRDANEDRLIDDNIIPGGAQEIEIVVQDRLFDANGQLYLPVATAPEDTNFPDPVVPAIPDLAGEPYLDFDFASRPSIVAEFFGDFILVNGVAWPVLNVEARKYRFRLLNGSDSRFYVLEFRDSQTDGTAIPFLQIGSDVGFLNNAIQHTQFTIAPGERADIVVDFAAYPGAEIFLRNFGPDEPFMGPGPFENSAEVDSTGQIMKFAVGPAIPGLVDATVAAGTALRTSNISPLVQNGPTRKLALFEGRDEFGRLQPILGTAVVSLDKNGNRVNGSLGWFNPITELPMLDDTEVWEIYNSTADAHPIHLHLVAFQVVNREGFTADVVDALQVQHDGTIGLGGFLDNIVLSGSSSPPLPEEAGWKDTVKMLPGQVTRVIARFDREGRYVWHCHILSHEDHEMMRPYEVITEWPMPPMH